MATLKIKTGEEFALKLGQLEKGAEKASKKAVFAGAKIVADEIRKNIEALPTEKYRYLKDGELFHGISKTQKKDLADGFGLTPIERDRNGDYNTHAGFDGYGSKPTKKYPKGLPNQLLARAIESGSSVRAPEAFVRPAINATRKKAVEAMQEVILSETSKIMNQK